LAALKTLSSDFHLSIESGLLCLVSRLCMWPVVVVVYN
jgi:hypothetical protein